ncbi:phosphotransferase [Deinococcus hopiensis]|uniref:Phosphotransferase enzyme family protein n=1 Tax=Deinococcus hopiensis KR-140 TaxID=695939 RepID=A0A1W1UCF4_9DEIO|nr:Phosphotransferase enzyme family protein [Deinococcus hopiensis KR-140]
MPQVIIWHPDGRRVLRGAHGWPAVTSEKPGQLKETAERQFNLQLWPLHEGGFTPNREILPQFRALTADPPPGLTWEEADSTSVLHGREWQRPSWPEWATQLLDTALDRVGWKRIGDLSPIHSWDLATVIRAETNAGRVYFKMAETGREASVTALLSQTLPGLVPPLLCTDVEKGVLVSASGGELLDGVGQVEAWEEVAQRLAQFQQKGDPVALAALGCPTYPLAEMAERIDAFLGDLPTLRDWGVEEESLSTLTEARPAVRAAFRNLTALGLPDLPAHRDAHPRNALHGERGGVWFDWSEAASAAHPFMDAGWFLWWTLGKPNLPVSQPYTDLSTRLVSTYLTALGCPDASKLFLKGVSLALLHRAVIYDSRFRHWEGTVHGWRPLYVPYYLRQAVRELIRL